MRVQIGDTVEHPESGRKGQVLDIHTNPACLIRTFDIRWEDGTEEEVEELAFGPLDDSASDSRTETAGAAPTPEAAAPGRLRLKRVYEPVETTDGTRVLVDRLWPRGVRKEQAQVDLWLKAIAPSPELREWFCHDPEKFAFFQDSYRRELATEPAQQQAVQQVEELLEQGPVTLLYAAKDPVHNHAVVLWQFLVDHLQSARS
ncbi:MAG: DUF488 domain-containing protein [Alicyclobacillus sp.]|nr:DUF488 domain-containing protein [Alicyclobacillus sp.]